MVIRMVKNRHVEWLLRWLKRGSFDWLLGWLKGAVSGGY